MTITDVHQTDQNPQTQEWLKIVADAVGSLRFGVVQIVVHGGKVVQIETTEKVRLDQPADVSRARKSIAP